MIVVAIVGILASIAIPSYTEYVKKGKAAEAGSQLQQLSAKLERYYADQIPPSYSSGADCGVAIPPPDAKYFSYECVTTGQTYDLKATGLSGEGMSGYEYTLDQTGAKSSSLPDGSSGACWLTSKGTSC